MWNSSKTGLYIFSVDLIIDKFLKSSKPLILNNMYVHYCILHFEKASCQFSLEDDHLVTSGYCELSVTEFIFLCLFLCFALPMAHIP